MPIGIVIAVAVVLIVVAAVISHFLTVSNLKNNAESKIGNAEARAREIIDDAVKTAEAKKKESLLEIKEESIKNKNELEKEDEEALKLNKNHYITLLGAFATLAVQLWTKSLPLGALVGLGIVFGGGAVSHRKMDKLINEGIGLMGYVAFVMLVAAGFVLVLKETGGIDILVNAIMPFMQNSKIIATGLMLFLGLFITMGIGTSFGTIPILAVLFIPICSHLGMSVPASIVVLAAAAALGDAGSPASDTTLGPTAGLNADGQHNHIWDTCIPTFLHYNIPIIIFALIAAIYF